MRLRIQTLAPLPELKAWYFADSDTLSDPILSTVAHLKQAICLQVPALRQLGVNGHQLVLLLDNFELLDGSPLDVVRDGDLICIKILPSAQLAIRRKRKAAVEDSLHKEKRQRMSTVFTQGRSVQTPTSRPLRHGKASKLDSDSSDEESSSSSSSSPSSSGSSSSSTFSSSLSSSSTSPATVKCSPVKVGMQREKLLSSTSSVFTKSRPTVRPGSGKPSTQSRNRRRRLKRKHGQVAGQPGTFIAPPEGISLTNLHPLGTRAQKDLEGPAEDVASALNNAFGLNSKSGNLDPGVYMDVDTAVASRDSSNEDTREVMMSTLRNKNKKKGFKQSMAVPLPRKIVFADPAAPIPSQVQNGVVVTSGSFIGTLVRLVVPSEKQDRGELPPRMFVTSVDVEKGMRGQPIKHSEHKADRGQQPIQDIHCNGFVAHGEHVSKAEPHAFGDGFVETLDLHWDLVERRWETFEDINEVEQLKVGICVGWKGLAIDPRTFTPEVVLSMARVISLPDPLAGQQLIVRQLSRPTGSEGSSLSFMLGLGGHNEDKEYEWSSVIGSRWKIVDIQENLKYNI